MFYSEYVLAKKGPLGKVWLAAHWNKKLTRAMIAKSDVVEACLSIIKPAAPLALRTSGHLLLGVVRIHDSKQKSLMNDCSEALIKIKVWYCMYDFHFNMYLACLPPWSGRPSHQQYAGIL
jgi:cohesin complex subunit SCC1